MNPSPYTQRSNQLQPRTPIHPSHTQPNRLLHPMIRVSIKLKLRPNRSPTSRRPNNFIRSHPHYYPIISPTNKRLIQPQYTYHNARTSMTPPTIMTPSHNMIYLHTSRNKPNPF
uniref:Macaca fascicularis brain cDNA clone: QmoA-11994, similar to human NADH dehydrogenase 1 (MTND1), mRNA, RefSeq: NM_173708.1 n=1 Tax=Macaca fascicularis TaxID=9541 RepID=I7GN95_MACFA|nr:unnamed protein product [Macaca fascicularis]BAE91117.1 unnamed protein product [Macaca fascicularis]